MVVLSAVIGYFVYRRYAKYRDFERIEEKTPKLRAFEFEALGPFILEASQFKFHQKFLTREEYHKWIDNDIRTFG